MRNNTKAVIYNERLIPGNQPRSPDDGFFDATTGTGIGVFSVNLATGAITGTISFSGLSSVAVAAHIHEGAAGVNGLIIIPLAGGIGLTIGTWTVPAGTVMTAAQIAELRAGGLYVQIHTVMFPQARSGDN